VELKYEPYRVFRRRQTPYALYARTHWIDGPGSGLKDATRRRVDSITKSQKKNGSWNDSVVRTVENLYILSLLTSRRSTAGARAVDWLLEKDEPITVRISGDGSPYTGLPFKVGHEDVRQIYTRRDLPFHQGCSGFFKTGAALYFSGIFKRADDTRVALAFKSLDKAIQIRGGKWCNVACSGNILRGYVAHPKKRRSSQTKAALRYLEQIQSKGGGWKGTHFFYQTFNTVAHSDLPSARRQMEKALDRIVRSQNRDGTWGRSNTEFNTFMVLDGLHRQGVL
jgi:hypothetical protein